MSDHLSNHSGLEPNAIQRLSLLRQEFAQRLGSGEPPRIEAFLIETSGPEATHLLRELLALEIEHRLASGENPQAEDYADRFPAYTKVISEELASAQPSKPLPNLDQMTSATRPYRSDSHRTPVGIEVAPRQIGRYLIERVLGKGGFGLVYLATDVQLQRHVAIKVPYRNRVASASEAEAYLTEARTVANLDHANIVPVYDVGNTNDYPCFIVSKYIDGTDLATMLRGAPLTLHAAVELVATVADALHFAHRQGLVHRDIKPANILLDKSGKAFVADFGLALREQDLGKGPGYAGTPAYMSPEQARGEGHRVDGRSDIFSLGVVLYLLLTGRQPFKAGNQKELIEQIASTEPRSPRQIDDQIPKELDRICLKALAKRASERYSIAREMADDLRHFLSGASFADRSTTILRDFGETDSAFPPRSGRRALDSASQQVRIIPKGLRSFDAHDADFFLELVPGPRDRDGLPDSLRFWKTRIEEMDPANSFSTGLVYGPSGCGKSSLIKAGLLPRLSKSIVAVYIEATPEDTEARLLRGLQRRLPQLSPDLGLIDALTALRRSQVVVGEQKVLLVLDQFEQWFHARQSLADADLVQALRQCDGGRLQCLILVRDDFGMAATRFMRELDIPITQGNNFATVDLFDNFHARKVLAAFGRAYGRLPESLAACSKEQLAFLDQAVAGLAQDGRVVSVRVALFAEMVKTKAWTPATLKAVGGTEGIGVTFLEETFSTASALPHHRLHREAAQNVLKSLLPEAGTDIKGHMQSRQHLLAASGYQGRPAEFDALIQILDCELRLITPTDPEGTVSESAGGEALTRPLETPSNRYFQLTHDYLVHSLSTWLTRAQKSSWRGRATLRLAERAALWGGKQESRYLPSILEWAQIHLLTRRKTWGPIQRQMMRQTDSYYSVRLVGLAALLVISAWGVREYQGSSKARALEVSLLRPGMAGVSPILDEMVQYRAWVAPHLQNTLATLPERSREEQLKIKLALLRWDPQQAREIYDSLLHASAQDFGTVRTELAPHKGQFLDELWSLVSNPAADPEKRFRAAGALATYAPGDSRWPEFSPFLVEKLAAEDALALKDWKDVLDPVGQNLLPALATALEAGAGDATQRRRLVELYASFSIGRPEAFEPLESRLAGVNESSSIGVDQARRIANVAACLVAMNRPAQVWPLLIFRPDPTLRSFLIERLGSSGIDARILKDRLAFETDPSARRALLLSLGSFAPERLPELHAVLLEEYKNNLDAGIHAAAGWVLRRWKLNGAVEEIDKQLATGRSEGTREWYLTKNQHTMSILKGPASLLEHAGTAPPRKVHRFAIASAETTVRQFLTFRKDHKIEATASATQDSPVNMTSWYAAAAYCNWLSRQEGLQEEDLCYRPGKDGRLDFVKDYQLRRGYRLPTEEEWEFACRAGASTLWSFGEGNQELASQYAWWLGNARMNGSQRAFPVATLKPNDWGLFDMHGNMGEWCQESKDRSPPIGNDIACGGRGGYFFSDYRFISSQSRFEIGRTNFFEYLSFRVARTEP